MSKNKKQPDPIRPLSLTFNIGFVEYGYQVDYYVDGVLVETECRDFADNYKIPVLQQKFITAVAEAIEKIRRKL